MKNRSGRQGIVGVVFRQRAVKFVGSRFGENLHVRATVPALGRVERRTRYPYCLNKVRFGRQVHNTVARSAVRAGAVDVIFVVFLSLPCGIYLIAGFLLEAIIVSGSGTKRTAAWQTRTGDAGSQLDHAGVNVSSKQRRVFNARLRYFARCIALVRLDRGDRSRDLNGGRFRRKRQRGIDRLHLVRFELHILLNPLLESGGVNFDRVHSARQR